MTTTTITSSSALRAAFAKAAAEATEVRVATAWASMSLVVGLDFDATDPAFLKHFSENRSEAEAGAPVKTFRDSGTFHPKVYLFNTRSAFTAIVGSSNFTDGGFGSNLEMNLLVTGKVSDSVFLELQGWIDAL
jgi:HKD family nuclease